MNENEINKRGLTLGISLIFIAAVLLSLAELNGIHIGKPQVGTGTVLLGIYIQYIGLLFLASYYFPHKSFLFRALMWVCEHMTRQPGKWNAFLFFFMGLTIGCIAILYGLGVMR